jgi:hypothetical protein
MDHKQHTNSTEMTPEGNRRSGIGRHFPPQKMLRSQKQVINIHAENNSKNDGTTFLTIDEISELVTEGVEETVQSPEKPKNNASKLIKSSMRPSETAENPSQTEIIAPQEEGGVQTKGQYEHFNVFEDYQFILCLNDFKSPSGMRTRHGYFEKLSNEFGRTMCSIRRRWERLNVLTASQKELVAEFFNQFSDVADQRRIVFAKNCTNVTLMSVDSTTVPAEEMAFFKQLKFKHMQIEPSIESESSSESETEESEESIEVPLPVVEEIIEKESIEEEPVVIEQPEEPKPMSVQMPELPKEAETSEDSVLLDISGDEEGVHFLQKLKKKITPGEFEPSNRNMNHKTFSDCHSSISDIIEDAIETQLDQIQLGQRRDRSRIGQQHNEHCERKRLKLDSGEQLNNCLKQKVETLKMALGDPSQFVDEKTELLRSLLLHFSQNYRCDLESLRTIVESQNTLNMEELKFRLCMRYLSHQPDLSSN